MGGRGLPQGSLRAGCMHLHMYVGAVLAYRHSFCGQLQAGWLMMAGRRREAGSRGSGRFLYRLQRFRRSALEEKAIEK